MTKRKTTAAKPRHTDEKMRKRSTRAAAGPKTKLGQLEGMIRRPEGATLAQLVKALAWQAHSVRGAMSGALKKHGLKITTSKTEGTARVYRITG